MNEVKKHLCACGRPGQRKIGSEWACARCLQIDSERYKDTSGSRGQKELLFTRAELAEFKKLSLGKSKWKRVQL